MNMTKREVREALGFTLDRQLTEFFGVGKAAVSNWPEDQPLPEMRQWQARALRPDVFGPGSETPAPSLQIRALVDSRMSKRALRARLGLASDAHLAKVLDLSVELVSGWADEDIVPALPQVMKLLGHPEQQEPAKPANDDPDADRIAPIEVA